MSTPSLTITSKFLSLVLRHAPETIGLSLDSNGWASVDDLLRHANAKGQKITRELLEEIVASNDKKRFAFSEDGSRIRANQGHSVTVDLALTAIEPPPFLFHGTATRFLDSIRAEGLRRGSRHHVHLSLEEDTAAKVGVRHGKLAILTVHAAAMHALGLPFYRSDNGVWLTEHVPVEFLTFPEEGNAPKVK